MNKTLKVLLLAGVVVLWVSELKGNSEFSRHSSLKDFEGEWVFEKAVYLERSSPTSDFRVKFEINDPKGLEELPGCLNQAVKFISIRDIIQVECPYSAYYGRGGLVTVNNPQGDEYLLTIGCDPDELGTESSVPGLFFNISGLNYQIEKIDEETISIRYEAVCVENSVETYGAVKCILKK